MSPTNKEFRDDCSTRFNNKGLRNARAQLGDAACCPELSGGQLSQALACDSENGRR
jgi:hypothetical protein